MDHYIILKVTNESLLEQLKQYNHEYFHITPINLSFVYENELSLYYIHYKILNVANDALLETAGTIQSEIFFHTTPTDLSL